MKTKTTIQKNLAAFVLALGIMTFPMFAFAADWAVSTDYNGNLSACVGNSGACNQSQAGGGGFALNNAFGLPSGSLLGILSNMLFWLLMIFAILGVVGFVISGIFYLLAGADEKNAEKGKKGMSASIVGIIVGLSGFLILQAINALLSGASKSF